MWIVVLGSKGEAADAIRRAQAAAEAECGRKLRVLRTDNRGEFPAAEFSSYCADEGVKRHYAPYSPQQNGVVKRRNQTVVGMARALLKQRGMPVIFWGEAVVTAVYILNRSPTKALNGRTPYETWHGRKLVVSHLWVFGCLAFGTELGHIGKLDDRSTPGVFIDYVEGSKAYRILDPGTACAHDARRSVRRSARMDMGQSGGRRLDSDVRQLHRRVRPLRGSWGSRQLSSTEHVYPSPRASTDLNATLSSHDLSCDDVFITTTTAGAPMHSSSIGHPSGHVYSSTSSR
jgi:hypothetical protein